MIKWAFNIFIQLFNYNVITDLTSLTALKYLRCLTHVKCYNICALFGFIFVYVLVNYIVYK